MLEILDVRMKTHQLMEVMLNKHSSIYFDNFGGQRHVVGMLLRCI